MDLHALVNSILSMQLPIARTKGLQLWCTFDSELPFLVNGDRQHLSQVLINLIGNSIKFTDVGSIHVHVLAVNQSNGNVNVRFEITDTGIGIQEEALPRVFDDFTQVSTSALRTIGGTGLGTTIAKQLVTLMKGDIGVISEYEKGSTFWFEIPFDVVSDEESYQITSSLVVLALEQRLPSVSRHLEQWGLAYDVAQSPAHLKSIIKPQSKTVVLVDEASLGSLSALQLAHELRALNTNASYSLILICHESSMIDESLLTQYYSSIVNHIDNKRVLFNAIHTAETVKFESDNVINLFDYYKQTNGVAALSILVADDNQVNRQVIESILRKVGHKVTLVSDGDEALDYLANHLDEVDLLILDKNMPNRSGDEVLKALAFMSPKQTFPVIMLTADATPEAKKESVELGVDDFLIKPIDAYALLDAIARLSVSEKVNTSEIVQSASTVEEATIPLCEPDALKQLMMLDSDPGFIQRLIDGFEYDANKHIKTILASVEHDFLELREALHALKGSANELGAKRLVSLCLSGEEIKPHQMGTEPVIQLATEIKDTYALTMNEIRTIISGK
jgi:two-component system sensor histidine kinase RpfC